MSRNEGWLLLAGIVVLAACVFLAPIWAAISGN